MNSTEVEAAQRAIRQLPTPVLSLHAIDRYRKRVKARARVEEIGQVLADAEIRTVAPGWFRQNGEPATAWAVAGAVAFPLILDGDALIAKTCVRKPQRNKADVRAYRELIREGWAA